MRSAQLGTACTAAVCATDSSTALQSGALEIATLRRPVQSMLRAASAVCSAMAATSGAARPAMAASRAVPASSEERALQSTVGQVVVVARAVVGNGARGTAGRMPCHAAVWPI